MISAGWVVKSARGRLEAELDSAGLRLSVGVAGEGNSASWAASLFSLRAGDGPRSVAAIPLGSAEDALHMLASSGSRYDGSAEWLAVVDWIEGNVCYPPWRSDVLLGKLRDYLDAEGWSPGVWWPPGWHQADGMIIARRQGDEGEDGGCGWCKFAVWPVGRNFNCQVHWSEGFGDPRLPRIVNSDDVRVSLLAVADQMTAECPPPAWDLAQWIKSRLRRLAYSPIPATEGWAPSTL